MRPKISVPRAIFVALVKNHTQSKLEGTTGSNLFVITTNPDMTAVSVRYRSSQNPLEYIYKVHLQNNLLHFTKIPECVRSCMLGAPLAVHSELLYIERVMLDTIKDCER